jgi:hypothetical protein
VLDGGGRVVMHMNGDNAALYVGAAGNEGDVILRNSTGGESIHLDGGSGIAYCNGWNITGNPARKVSAVWLFADDGTDTVEIDLGVTRQVFAHTAMVGMDPRHDHDHGDAFAVDIFRIDDAIVSGHFISGGAHFGSPGSNSNIKYPTYYGLARKIQFRARSFQDASVFAIGVVYWE